MIANGILNIIEFIQCGDVWLFRFECPICGDICTQGFPSTECGSCKEDISKYEIKNAQKRYLAGTRRKYISKKLIKELLKEYGFACAYCYAGLLTDSFEIDHIFPVCRGGSNLKENLCPACKECNGVASGRFFLTKEIKRDFILSRRAQA